MRQWSSGKTAAYLFKCMLKKMLAANLCYQIIPSRNRRFEPYLPLQKNARVAQSVEQVTSTT